MQKECSECGATFEPNKFVGKRAKTCGPECLKKLKARYQRDYQGANKEKISERRRKYREANKEKIAERQREYRRANKEKIAQAKRKWYQENADRLRQKQLDYLKTDTGRMVDRKANQKRRARKRGATVEDIDYDLIWIQCKQECQHCHVRLFRNKLSPTHKHYAHFDHIVPLSRGGTHTQDNLQVLCPGCNLRKGSKLEEELDYLK